MPGHRSQPALAVVFKLYQALLHIYPAEHRREYGLLMARTFRDMCRESYRQRGKLGLILISVHTLVDTIFTAIMEHLDSLKYGDSKMTKQQHVLILASAGFPLSLGIGLFALNPRYMGRMFLPGYANAQPLGGIMTAAIVVLGAVAYAVQRWSLTLSGQLAGEGNKGKVVVSRICFVTSFILFVLPAVFLVVFGPAVLRLVEIGAIG
jgi:hypothetical protein